MSVKLVAITVGAGELQGKTAEEIISFCARVSNPSNQLNFDSAPKLLKYCLENGHVSIFEQSYLTIEITTSRAIAQQILRHRSFCFQEFCLSGDTIVSCYKNFKKTKDLVTIKELYRRKVLGIKLPTVKVYDEEIKEFVEAPIKDVFYTGIQKVMRIELENGKTIICTKNHKLMGRNCFVKAEELKVGDVLTCNGIPAYQDREILRAAKEEAIKNKTGVNGIAAYFGVSYHTIRKWLKLNQLQFTKKEVASIYPVWNKELPKEEQPKFEKPVSELSRNKMKISSLNGSKSRFYKNGESKDAPFRLRVWQWAAKHNYAIRLKYNNTCANCNKSEGQMFIDHIEAVSQCPEKAFEIDNLQLLCKDCHKEKSAFELRMTIKYSQIKKIDYVGEEETYDLEVDHPSHNFIANGIVSHNSQRYAEVLDYVEYEPRRQDKKNRQNSIDDLSEETKEWFLTCQKEIWNSCYSWYKEAVERGVAKECSRFLLPLNTQTTLYMTGSARSWIFYLQTRLDSSTQKEHRDIALEIKEIFKTQFPNVSEALEW